MADHAIQVTINAKDEATKQIKEIDKQLAALTKKKQTISVDLSTTDAQKELAKVTTEIEKLKSQKAEIVVEANVTKVLAALDDVAAETKKTEAAAKSLSDALGPELAKGADVDAMVSDFRRLGLSVDDIIANADRLGAKLREIGQRDVGGKLTTGLRGASQEARSAAGSASVFANAIGNTTQDIGQLAGLSGTAGVAIGQMAEYMSDASLEGEKFSTVLGNFGAVAGPILLLVGAMELINGVMAAHKKAADESAAATEQLGKAMEGASDPALGLANNMKPIVDRLKEFDRIDPGFWTDLTKGIEGTAAKVPLLGTALGALGVDVNDMVDSVTNVMPALQKAGVDAFDLSKFIAGTGEAAGTKITKAFQAGIINATEYVAALKAITDEREKAAKTKATDDAFFKVSLGQLRALDDAANKAKNPLKFYSDQWNILMNDMRDGSIDTQAAADAVNFLNEQLGLTPDQIRQIALDELDNKAKATAKAFDDTGKALQEWADKTIKAFEDANQAFLDIGTAQGALNDLSNAFNTMARSGDAIKAAFDLGNRPLEVLDQVTDIHDAMRDLSKFISDPKGLKGKIPNIFDPNDVNAGPFLQKIDTLRGPIQQAVADAFESGGPVAAQQTADSYVKQIVGSLKGKLKPGDVEALLGLHDLEATLKVAVDQKSAAEAQAMLDILTNLTGETAWTAQLKFDLIAGNIDANTAKELIAGQAKTFGIDVPTSLLEPDAKSKSAAKAAADRWAADNANKIGLGTVVAKPGVQALVDARNGGQTDANKVAPIVFPSTVATPTIKGRAFDAGGTVGSGGGIAGERRPEIINNRFLLTEPSWVPPGTRVTSGARTARILRTRGTRGLRHYDSGGIVPGATSITINAAVVGNRYDVMRAIAKANRDSLRLRGTRG